MRGRGANRQRVEGRQQMEGVGRCWISRHSVSYVCQQLRACSAWLDVLSRRQRVRTPIAESGRGAGALR